MYKLLVPALALLAAMACNSAANPTAADLKADAAKAQQEAAVAKADAERAQKEAEKQAREAAAKAAEWHEFQQATWDPTWDKFNDSKEPRFQGTGYALERDTTGSTGSITVRRVRPIAPVEVQQDTAIKSAVEAKFATDKDVSGRNIDVQVVDNVVHLRGTVGSKAESREAVRLALNTRGVYDVISHLTVK